MFIISCKNDNSNIVDVTNIDKKLYKGISKDSVIFKFGKPKDSLESTLNANKVNYYFIYNTNDFQDIH